MENIFEVLKTQVSLEKTLNQRLDEFEARLEGSSKDLSLKDLSSDYINFKNFVYSTLTLLRQQINHLIVNVDAIESRHRKKFLLLGGVVENTNENVRELVASVITKSLGIKNCSGQSLQFLRVNDTFILLSMKSDSRVSRLRSGGLRKR
ncbi:unnamed protein product [Parnassius apollo]|uniref:(apollo) hypothetical protein n=1 Tax=Parnassius apollo TaxID=110799 RepID=A0A8S3W1U8_PARAO|nr:unnamed protein product [Parnassius apollo]